MKATAILSLGSFKAVLEHRMCRSCLSPAEVVRSSVSANNLHNFTASAAWLASRLERDGAASIASLSGHADSKEMHLQGGGGGSTRHSAEEKKGIHTGSLQHEPKHRKQEPNLVVRAV